MNLLDKVIFKEGDTVIDNIFFMCEGETPEKLIFVSEENLTYNEEEAVIWMGNIGGKAIRPLKSSLEYVQIDETTYELDILEFKISNNISYIFA